jgi:hypothetical protein
MDRNATEKHQFLIWVGETPYMVTWTPAGETGTMSATLAGDFIGSEDWSRSFQTSAVDDIGLETWAAQIAAYEHAAAAGRHHHRMAA